MTKIVLKSTIDVTYRDHMGNDERLVEAMLVSLGREEADAAVAAGHGQAHVQCEFCGQAHHFDAVQISRLFALADSAHSAAAGVQ